jgi:MFS family permease
VFPFVADNFGRKKSESISWCIAAAGAILLACSFNIVMAGIGLFLCGLGSNSAINLHYTFIKEFVIGRARDIMIISLQITFSLGVCAIAFVAMLIPNWRIITICFFAVPMLLLVFTYRFVEETPEFNIIQGLQTFTNSLNRIARVNKRSELEL